MRSSGKIISTYLYCLAYYFACLTIAWLTLSLYCLPISRSGKDRFQKHSHLAPLRSSF